MCGRMLTAQPFRAHPLRIGDRVRPVQLGGGLREGAGERHRVQGARVERHERPDTSGVRVLEERRLQRRQAPAPLFLRRRARSRAVRVLDLQHVDLETGQDAALDTLHQAELVQHGPVQLDIVHRGHQAPADRFCGVRRVRRHTAGR